MGKTTQVSRTLLLPPLHFSVRLRVRLHAAIVVYDSYFGV